MLVLSILAAPCKCWLSTVGLHLKAVSPSKHACTPLISTPLKSTGQNSHMALDLDIPPLPLGQHPVHKLIHPLHAPPVHPRQRRERQSSPPPPVEEGDLEQGADAKVRVAQGVVLPRHRDAAVGDVHEACVGELGAGRRWVVG